MSTEMKNQCEQVYICKCNGDYIKCVFGKRPKTYTHCQYFTGYKTKECINIEAKE